MKVYNNNKNIAPSFIVTRFPKEFKKNWLKSFDYRFLIVFIITLISMIGCVSYLSSHILIQKSLQDVSHIHKNYARLLVQNVANNSFEDFEQKSKQTYLFGTNKQAQSEIIKLNEQASAPSSPIFTQKFNKGSNENNSEQLSNGRKNNLAKNIGIFEFITTESRLTENPLDEVSGIGNESSLTMLSNVNGETKAQYSSSINNSEHKKSYTIRGSKAEEIEFKHIAAAISPKGKIKSKVFDKNVDREEIPSTELIGTKKKRGKNGKARSPDDISQVIVSHNLVIQDCYKQALKRNSKLKGKIVIRFSVRPDGTVDQVKAIRSTLNNTFIEKCIIKKIKKWNDFGACSPEVGNVYYRQTYVFGY